MWLSFVVKDLPWRATISSIISAWSHLVVKDLPCVVNGKGRCFPDMIARCSERPALGNQLSGGCTRTELLNTLCNFVSYCPYLHSPTFLIIFEVSSAEGNENSLPVD